MKKKPKIAVIGLKGLPAFGGAATVGENIIEQLKDQYDFTVYSTSSHTDLKTGEYNGYKQIVFSQKKKSGLNSLLYYIKSVFHAILLEKYDLIHLHHNAASFLLPILRMKYKVVLTTHGLFTEEKFYYLKHLYKIFDRLFLKFSNIITCVSKEDCRTIKNIGINDAMYIPNGINIPYKKNDLYENEEEYILFAAGRIHEGKGCHILLEALIQMDFSGRLIIAGDLNQSKNYKKYILKLLNKLNNYKLTGMIKDKDLLYSLIQNAKLFVYPSHSEAMSIMMLEVSSLKTPMICCDCQVNRDLFSEDEVIFAEQDNVLDWRNKIEWALVNTNEMNRLSLKAYDKLKKFHTWEKIAQQYKKAYDELL
jgi:glycosyltransferase involved in cell wall biosynthesis